MSVEGAERAAAAAFPKQVGRTRNFTLGVPRSFAVAEDGSRVAFLRTLAGDDPVTCLWALEVATGEERLVFDPRSRGDGTDEELTDAERGRRERTRESAGGIVAYTADRLLRRAAFVLSGRLFLADLPSGGAEEIDVPGPVDQPLIDPAGDHVAFVVEGALHIVGVSGVDRVVAVDEDPDVSWGLPEFIAAEEMDRHLGMWWSPDGSRLAATQVDERPVAVWHIANPTDPAAEPRAVRYPAAGTDNAIVALSVFDVARGGRVDVEWDRGAFPYLARVDWSEGAPLTLLVQSRDQRTTQVLEVDGTTGAANPVREDRDEAWIELMVGSPGRLSDGRLVCTADAGDTRSLVIGRRSSRSVRSCTARTRCSSRRRTSLRRPTCGAWSRARIPSGSRRRRASTRLRRAATRSSSSRRCSTRFSPGRAFASGIAW